jgi:2-polyprenyl-6-methoxyphenol hydroxylase-like FAD-dependent oxidoreductase
MITTQPSIQKHSIAIAGAGLAGLCLAQALLQAGFDVQVYERDSSPHARRQGYRITVDEYGAGALKQCLPPHLFQAVLATASPRADVGYFHFTNQNLGEIFSLTFKTDKKKSELEAIGQVDRATLRTIMLSGLEGRVHFGKAATHIESAVDGATLYFADGSSISASVVVGADGIHSALREQILPGCPIIDTGSRGIYGKTPLIKGEKSLVPKPLENSGVMALSAPGKVFFFTTMHFKETPQEVFARLVPDQEASASGDYVMWAVVLMKTELPENVWKLDAKALHQLALDASSDYHPILRRFVENADVDYTVVTTLSVATQPKVWPASRATLMGDAVHVMPPTGAHGGNTAMRDAALLADKLISSRRNGISVEQAIQEYQDEMIPYAFKEVRQSVAMLARGNIKNPLIRWLMMRALPWFHSLVGKSLTA